MSDDESLKPITLDPRFSGLDGAGTCPDNKKSAQHKCIYVMQIKSNNRSKQYVSVMWHNRLNFGICFYCYHIKVYYFLFTHVVFLYGTVELFTDTRQNTMFTRVGSHLSCVSGSMRDTPCLNSFIGRTDLLSGKTEIRINQVRKSKV